MSEHNRIYKAFESSSLTKRIDKINKEELKECPHCGNKDFGDYDTILECKICKSKFFKANMEKITDPKLLISIQQIQDIIREYGLDKNNLNV